MSKNKNPRNVDWEEDEESRILDRDYSLDGGVTMVRRDFQHGFEGEGNKYDRIRGLMGTTRGEKYQKIMAKNEKSDQDIFEEALEILFKNKFLDATDIQLEVKNGVLVLNGWVETREDKKEAERCIELISGIRDVLNLIHLRSRLFIDKKGESMKTLQEIMAKKVAFATPETPLVLIAKNMISFDCGEVPIVNSDKDKKVVGVVTDRDIVCRTLGQGKNPMNLFAKDCMTKEVVTIDVSASIPECIKLMRDNKIRRIPVIDKNKNLCGIVSLSDLVVEAESDETVKLVHDISTPGHSPSALQ
jgi:CBS domain-containing protein